MSKKVVVTGGAGFIGSHIAKLHLDKGDVVTVIDNLQTGSLKNIEAFQSHPNFSFVEADLRKFPDLEKLLGDVDSIYHMAANVGQKFVLNHPIATLTNNIEGAQALFEAVDKSKSRAKVLLASTSEIYCHSDIGPQEKVKEDTISSYPSGAYIQETYPLAKLINEVMGLSYQHEKGVDIVICRLFNTIGPRQSPAYGMVVPNFMRQAISGQPITVFGDGLQTRSFSSVHDTVKALSLLMESSKSTGKIVNVGDDRECSILDLANLIKKLTNSDSEIVFTDYKQAYGVDFVDVRRRCPDLSKLKELTGFTPSIALENTLKEIIPEVQKEHESQV